MKGGKEQAKHPVKLGKGEGISGEKKITLSEGPEGVHSMEYVRNEKKASEMERRDQLLP